MCNPRVYVGTYGKYNSGSLKGGWLNLLECKDYKQFLSKCRALHLGERDPEFMIQDVEDFPDGLECGEWLSEQDFNDVIEACKEEDGPTDSTMSLAEALRAALLMRLGKSATPKQTAKVDDKALLEEYMTEWLKVYPKDKGMLDYHRKEWSGGVRLQNGGILCFDRPRIDNAFCFHDEGEDYEYYKHLMADKETRLRDYFLARNLADFDRKIEDLTDDREWADGYLHTKTNGRRLYVQRASYSGQSAPLNIWSYVAIDEWDLKNNPSWYCDIEPMTEADRKAILEGLKREREKFDKRLQTYLKRYGVSKIRTWTYWADA